MLHSPLTASNRRPAPAIPNGCRAATAPSARMPISRSRCCSRWPGSAHDTRPHAWRYGWSNTMNSQLGGHIGDQSARLEPIELTAQNAARRDGDLAVGPRPGQRSPALSFRPSQESAAEWTSPSVICYRASRCPTGHHAATVSRSTSTARQNAGATPRVAMSSTKCRPDIRLPASRPCMSVNATMTVSTLTGRDQSLQLGPRQRRRTAGHRTSSHTMAASQPSIGSGPTCWLSRAPRTAGAGW